MPPFYESFEIDIIEALSDQLTSALNQLVPAPLDPAHFLQLPTAQGVYTLWYSSVLVYVGKTNDLQKRLREHYEKISGRMNINVSDMEFSALLVHPNWTALAPETALIKHYKKAVVGCEWNGNGFGPHDPGRDRETTNKPPDGFDTKYPIQKHWPCPWFTSKKQWGCLDLLVELKRFLPYLLRYQTDQIGPRKFEHFTKGHADQRALTVSVPSVNPPTSAQEILALVAAQLPGWQATVFPSHMILYKESKNYLHGITI